jgi:hypothetical protein
MGLWNIGIIDTNNGGYLVYNRFEVGTLRNNYDSIVKSLCLKVLKKAQEYVMLVEDVRSEI